MSQDVEEKLKSQIMRGDGEMATLMRNLDWSQLPTGPVTTWCETFAPSSASASPAATP